MKFSGKLVNLEENDVNFDDEDAANSFGNDDSKARMVGSVKLTL